MHYRRVWLYGDPHHRERHWSTGSCSVEGCDKPPKGRHCKMHATRLRRTGTTESSRTPGRHTNEKGYEVIKRPGHPVAQKNGWAYEHRVVLFDALGADPQPCHWCGKPVRWLADYGADNDYLVVDHLDGDRGNNDLGNLVPSCNPCNTTHSYVITITRQRRGVA